MSFCSLWMTFNGVICCGPIGIGKGKGTQNRIGKGCTSGTHCCGRSRFREANQALSWKLHAVGSYIWVDLVKWSCYQFSFSTSPFLAGNAPTRKLPTARSLGVIEESHYLQASLDSTDILSERRGSGEAIMSPYFLKSMTPSSFEAALRQKDGELQSYVSRLVWEWSLLHLHSPNQSNLLIIVILVEGHGTFLVMNVLGVHDICGQYKTDCETLNNTTELS